MNVIRTYNFSFFDVEREKDPCYILNNTRRVNSTGFSQSVIRCEIQFEVLLASRSLTYINRFLFIIISSL